MYVRSDVCVVYRVRSFSRIINIVCRFSVRSFFFLYKYIGIRNIIKISTHKNRKHYIDFFTVFISINILRVYCYLKSNSGEECFFFF